METGNAGGGPACPCPAHAAGVQAAVLWPVRHVYLSRNRAAPVSLHGSVTMQTWNQAHELSRMASLAAYCSVLVVLHYGATCVDQAVLPAVRRSCKLTAIANGLKYCAFRRAQLLQRLATSSFVVLEGQLA